MKHNSRLKQNMIRKYNMKGLLYDFMGYSFDTSKDLSFHHLIIPFKICRFYGMGKGNIICNGTLLNRNSSHPYLHVIENYDEERFLAITSEMIDEVIKRRIDMVNIKQIHDILYSFEKEYCNMKNCNGEYIIKEEFLRKRIHIK